jgi:hypothetical protein
VFCEENLIVFCCDYRWRLVGIRGGREEEERRKRGGREEEERRKRGGREEEERRKRGGREEEERRKSGEGEEEERRGRGRRKKRERGVASYHISCAFEERRFFHYIFEWLFWIFAGLNNNF